MITRRAFAIAAGVLIPAVARGQVERAYDPRLRIAADLDVVTNGVAVTAGGRVFLVLARFDGSNGPRIVERRSGVLLPYPDRAWNAWAPGGDATRALVRVNSVRIGPEGDLWIVDVGAPGFGNPALPGGPKLVRVDLGTDSVRRVYGLDSATNNESFIDDVRFNAGTAYLTDAGSPGLIVLDLASGAAHRVLEHHPSTTAARPMSAEGRIMRGPDGKPVLIHADQLEVSPDGRWLYYQPASGPLSRIETRWLDPSVSPEVTAAHVQPFAATPATGGTAIDAQGDICLSDTDQQRILKVLAAGRMTTVVQDPRLLWVDAMWIDHFGDMWMPAAQLNGLRRSRTVSARFAIPCRSSSSRSAPSPPREITREEPLDGPCPKCRARPYGKRVVRTKLTSANRKRTIGDQE